MCLNKDERLTEKNRKIKIEIEPVSSDNRLADLQFNCLLNSNSFCMDVYLKKMTEIHRSYWKKLGHILLELRSRALVKLKTDDSSF